MLYQQQAQLNKVLQRENLTKLSGVRQFLLAVKYIIEYVICALLSYSNKSINKAGPKDNSLLLSWSPLHNRVLEANTGSKNIKTISSPLQRNDIINVIESMTIISIFKQAYKNRTVNGMSFSFIIAFERAFFLALFDKTGVTKVCISGHYDRYVCTIANLAKEKSIILYIYQHGAVASLKGLPKFHADKIFIQYKSSEDTFKTFYNCEEFELTKSIDSSRIESGFKIEGDNLSILYIGQDKLPQYNAMVFSELVSVLSHSGVKYKIYHLRHPRDTYEYERYDNYLEISDTPSNPDFVFSRYSTLAYSYHMLGYNVYFVNLDDINVDFMSDERLKILPLDEIKNLEYSNNS